MKKTLFIITFSFMLSLVLAGAIDLADYPYPFVVNGVLNTKIIVGQNAATSDVIGAIDVATSIIAQSRTDIYLGKINSLFDTHLGMLDVNAPKLGSTNMIIVGGPCANSIAAELLEYPSPCHKDFEVGKATVRYFPEKKALLIAGYDAQETLAASYILSDYEDYDLSDLEMEITVAGLELLAINPVVT